MESVDTHAGQKKQKETTAQQCIALERRTFSDGRWMGHRRHVEQQLLWQYESEVMETMVLTHEMSSPAPRRIQTSYNKGVFDRYHIMPCVKSMIPYTR